MYVGKTRRYLKYKLDKDMKRGRLTKLEDLPRGIGKSTLIARLAKENGWIVVEPTLNHLRNFKHMFPDVECINARAIAIGDRRKFILDEGIADKEEKHLRKHFTVVGGFSGLGNTPWAYVDEGQVQLVGSVAHARHHFDKALEPSLESVAFKASLEGVANQAENSTK